MNLEDRDIKEIRRFNEQQKKVKEFVEKVHTEGLCSAHQKREDPSCKVCYPNVPF